MRTARLVLVGRVPLAFGLNWLPLLGDQVSSRAQVQARRFGASHRVLSGEPSAALGLACGLDQQTACWSAADLLARQYPRGTVACVIALDEQSWHVLASHEGVALVRADQSYLDPELAQQAIESLRLAHPRLQLLSDETVSGSNGLLQVLARQSASAPAMEPISRRKTGWWLLLLVVWVLLLFWYGADRLGAASRAESVDITRLAWQQAIEQVLSARPIHGAPGTRALLQALYDQPARIAGWSLQGLRCQPRTVILDWQCSAEYRRQNQQADNRGILQAAPAHWRLDFPSLDLARATWVLTLPGQIPNPQTLPTGGILARDWASALQEILPAFSALRLEPPRALVIPAPRDEQGQDLPAPPDLPSLSVRGLRIEGPLRSGALLIPLAHSVSWHKAVLSLAPGARPGARASRLILHLEGTVYENRS